MALNDSPAPPTADRMLAHHSIMFAGTHLYTWVERVTMKVKCLSQQHIYVPGQPRLKPGLLDLEASTLTMWPLYLPKLHVCVWCVLMNPKRQANLTIPHWWKEQ